MQSLNRLKSVRKRRAYDFYETPSELVKTTINRIVDDEGYFNPSLTFDVGAGSGIWGSELKKMMDDAYVVGIEQQDLPKPDGFNFWWVGDYMDFTEYENPTIIMGNPPYSLAEEFVRKSMSLITKDNLVFFLLRLGFLESKKRHFGLFTEYRPKRVYVLSRRPSFFTTKSGSKTTDALSYAIFLWQKGWNDTTFLDWMYWDYK